MTAKRSTTRRDFLKGKSAADALIDLAQPNQADHGAVRAGSDSDDSPTTTPTLASGANYLLNFGRRAMACDFEVYLNAGQHERATEAAIAALDRVDQLEDQMSVYRDRTAISDINRRAYSEPVKVEERLFELLVRAQDLCHQTNGAFDITSGPLSKAWGFFQRSGRFPEPEALDEARRRIGSRWVRLDREQQTIRFLEAGVEINLNSIGKGYALDRAALELKDAGVDHFLFHGGQSSVLVHGSNAATPTRGWTVGLKHPLRPERRLAEFYLQDQALGTSGSGTQFFHHRGQRYGHVIDPRTGQPAQGVYSATVIAPNARDADALATAFYVMGPVSTAQYCRAHPEIKSVLVCPGEREGTVQLHVTGLLDEEWCPLDPGAP